MARINWNKRHLSSVLELQSDKELQNKEHVTEIHLCFNFIVEAPAGVFSRYTALASLSLSCNNLTAIPLLRETPSLRELHLDCNQISVMEHLEFIPKLECLNLRCNQIHNVDNLLENGTLQRLSLSGNPISSLSWDQIPRLSQLKFLGFYGSKISNFEDILKLLSLMPTLTDVSLGCGAFCNGRPLKLSSILLSSGHIEVGEVTRFLFQLKESLQCSETVSATTPMLERVCEDYSPWSGHALTFVASILVKLKATCPSLVAVDGERIFCAE